MKYSGLYTFDEETHKYIPISSIKEILDVKEDYEEPKKYFYIYADGDIYEDIQDNVREDNGCKEIGNYFETKEEAERAVEKLKAWKRLRENGFRFKAYQLAELNIKFFLDHGYTKMGDDLDLLFGGEE